MLKNMGYFDVYVLCQTANRLLDMGFERTVNDFFEPFSENYHCCNEFNKYSILHSYIEWVIEQNIWEKEKNIVLFVKNAHWYKKSINHNAGTLWVDYALNHYFQANFDFLTWLKENSDKNIEAMEEAEIEDFRYEYLSSLQLEEELLENLMHQLSNEIFYILFQNREFLYRFNRALACHNEQTKERISVPQWTQRAVFFRDRGCCVFCGKDLSGITRVPAEREIQYDHIIALANNGINDISNLQLSCQQCNLEKNKKNITSTLYQQWYETE